MEPGFLLRYYCGPNSDRRGDITDLLQKIKEKHGIPFQIRDLRGDDVLEREAYEHDFKPVARVLKRRTGSKRGIRQLRGRRSGAYYVSVPGTMAIIGDGKVQWYTLGAPDILQFLNEVFEKGKPALAARSESPRRNST
jgi:hypothetical protein